MIIIYFIKKLWDRPTIIDLYVVKYKTAAIAVPYITQLWNGVIKLLNESICHKCRTLYNSIENSQRLLCDCLISVQNGYQYLVY